MPREWWRYQLFYRNDPCVLTFWHARAHLSVRWKCRTANLATSSASRATLSRAFRVIPTQRSTLRCVRARARVCPAERVPGRACVRPSVCARPSVVWWLCFVLRAGLMPPAAADDDDGHDDSDDNDLSVCVPLPLLLRVTAAKTRTSSWSARQPTSTAP